MAFGADLDKSPNADAARPAMLEQICPHTKPHWRLAVCQPAFEVPTSLLDVLRFACRANRSVDNAVNLTTALHGAKS